MSLVKKISTVNVKPSFVCAPNIAPSFVNTIQYAGYVNENNTNRYGGFKYGARKYGPSTQYSVGQTMPSLNTLEI